MDKIIYFIALAIFPFGQLIKYDFLSFFDYVIFALSVYVVLNIRKYIIPSWYKYLFYFILFALFSWIVNYSDGDRIFGLLYLLRFFSYSLISVLVFNYKKYLNRITLNLYTIIIATAFFAWIQYLFLPDLRALLEFNWDDHYYRLVGTLLDPNFLAVVLNLGIVMSLYNKKYIISFVLFVSLLFTYSRSGYISLFIPLLYLLFTRSIKFLQLFVFGVAFLLFVFYPKSTAGEGVNLARTASIDARFSNYVQTLEIYKQNYLFGIGFNNLCSYKIDNNLEQNLSNHSCSGSDSSILLLLATTGVVGLILFINLVYQLVVSIENKYKKLFVAIVISLFTSSLFINSLFYPHVLFIVFTVVGLWSKSEG